ncbi:MAG: sulfotransferase domain-containing protein [Bacteroidales bacterium]
MPPGLVWIASYPKSGNTWMRVLLANLAAGGDRPADINALDSLGGIASSRHDFEDLTLVDSTLLREEEAELLRPAFHDAMAGAASSGAACKVHDAYTRLEDGTPLLGRGARAALYMVRDPRDVAVSFAFHQNISLDQATQFLCRPAAHLKTSTTQFRQRLLCWSNHVASWLDQADLPVHLLRYEDLCAAPLEEFRRALDFLGIRAAPQEIHRAVAHSDFAELQRQEQDNGFRERLKDQQTFFRRGKVGDWRNHLNHEQVRLIETAHAAMMDRLGYDRITKAEEQ